MSLRDTNNVISKEGDYEYQLYVHCHTADIHLEFKCVKYCLVI